MYITAKPAPITYEVSTDEPLHPDQAIADRMYEHGLSTCKYGCKVYADPWSHIRVVAHDRAYGCMR